MMATRTNTDVKKPEETTAPVTTSYTIRSRESFQRPWWVWPFTAFVVVPFAALATDSFWSRSDASNTRLQHYYETYNEDNFMVAGAFSVVVVFLYIAHRLFSTSSQTRDVDLSLTIFPLGVQRLKKTTTTTYIHDQHQHQKTDEYYYPLLPIETVKDCIVLEHVGAFSVSTHVMIRLKSSIDSTSKQNKNGANESSHKKEEDVVSGLVVAFPGANLTFDRCLGLVNQIGRALKEVQ